MVETVDISDSFGGCLKTYLDKQPGSYLFCDSLSLKAFIYLTSRFANRSTAGEER
jgi:hypothetical protein